MHLPVLAAAFVYTNQINQHKNKIISNNKNNNCNVYQTIAFISYSDVAIDVITVMTSPTMKTDVKKYQE